MFNFSSDQNIKNFEMLLIIRKAELLLADKAAKKQFNTPIHLGIGQEAIAVGISKNLQKSDFIFGNHRSHAHYLASGGSLFKLFAEILGKSDGCSGGKGGSMHITSPENGFIGSMPIVAGTIPIALGGALTCKISNNSSISVSYFGDGAAEEGVFHEALNLAAIMELPILFVCENNLFSSHLHISERQPNHEISRFAIANKIRYLAIDGNNLNEVEKESKKLISEIRQTRKPGFIEAFTYRLYGHVGFEVDEMIGFNRKKDLEIWSERDPVKNFSNYLVSQNDSSAEMIFEIEKKVSLYVESEWQRATEADYPSVTDLDKNVYYEAKI
jgi:pyruvate dehydrogenase E1 component alpha subunit